MDPTISISKGCFVFNSDTIKTFKKSKRKTHNNVYPFTINNELITKNLCYKIYKNQWNWINENINKLQNRNCIKIIENIIEFIMNAYENNIDMLIPTVALLTGINQPDHLKQFENLSKRIKNNLKSNVIILQSRDCPTLKTAIETVVYEFIEGNDRHKNNKDNTDSNYDNDGGNDDNDDDDDNDVNVDNVDRSPRSRAHHKRTLKRSQCNMQVLKSWYQIKYPSKDKSLIIILSDFECFSIKILEDFILIINSYLQYIPFILIFGIATSISCLNDMLSYRVTSKIRLKIFHFDNSANTLNQIIDNVILSPKCPFRLSGKIFQFLCDIFLFYDFSINGFIQGFKYCMMEHFLQGNVFSICTNYEDAIKILSELTHNDCEMIRHQLSFRSYVESLLTSRPKKVIAILTDDDYLRKKLKILLKNCHIFFILYRYYLEFFICLIDDLPKTPICRLRRELYSICMTRNILDMKEFKDCWQMLGFLSKNEFLHKIMKAINTLEEYVQRNTENGNELDKICAENVNLKMKILKDHLKNVTEVGETIKSLPHTLQQSSSPASSSLLLNTSDTKKQMTRYELKEKLLNLSKTKHTDVYNNKSINITDFINALNTTLDYIKTEIIGKYLIPLNSKNMPTFYELFVFSDLSSVRHNIVGTPRGALHTALNNPNYYLQCDCCKLNQTQTSSSILPTLPDISIIYKLHLECGRMINLFDWLQAFKMIVSNDNNEDNNDEEDNNQIDPGIQARFARAVAELQFLGYIKASKRKTDHVSRLTW